MNISATKKTVFSGHRGPVYTITPGLEEGIILSGSSDQRIGSWSAITGDPGNFSANMPTHIIALLSLPAQQLIFAGTSAGTLHILDPVSHKEARAEKYFDSQIFDIAYSAKHHLLLVSSGDGQVTVTDSSSFEKLKTIRLCNDKIRSVSIHPDEDLAAIASSDGMVRIFSLPLMKEIHAFTAHDLGANVVCWHPEGKYLLSGGRDAHLNVWDPANGFERIQAIAAHNYAIYSIAFSPDGKRFATASRDKTVKVWNASDVSLLLRINKEKQEGHLNSVNKVIWTNEGLVSTGDDRAIILWEISA